MLPDGIYIGVVDRFEEDAEGHELAVIMLEEDGEVVEQFDLHRGELPTNLGQDSVVDLRIDSGDVVAVTLNPEETKTRAEEAQSRFDRLAERPHDQRDSDNESDPK